MKQTSCSWLLATLLLTFVSGVLGAEDKPDKAGLDFKRLTELVGDPTPKIMPEGKLERLMAERVVVAYKVYRAQEAKYQEGSGKFEDMVKAARRLLGAELATKATLQDRIAVLEKAVEVEKEFERVVKAKVDAMQSAAFELADAQYDRLTAEIELEKAKKAPPRW